MRSFRLKEKTKKEEQKSQIKLLLPPNIYIPRKQIIEMEKKYFSCFLIQRNEYEILAHIQKKKNNVGF